MLIAVLVSVGCGWLSSRSIHRWLRGIDAHWVPRAIAFLRLPVSLLGGLLVFYLINLTALSLTGPIAWAAPVLRSSLTSWEKHCDCTPLKQF